MKTFYHVLINTVIATITNMTVWFAIIFYLYLQTKSVFVTSILSGVYLLSVAITGIWFGSLVDHHKKKTIMLISSCVSLVLFSICSVIYFSAGDSVFKNIESVTLWVFSVLLLFGVISGNIRTIALTTIVKILIPEKDHDKANGLAGTANGLAFLIVSVISGFLVGWAGMYWVMILSVILTLVCIVHLWFQQIPEHGVVHLEGEQKPKHIDLKGTIKVIRAVPGLLPLILFAAFNNFLGGVYMSLLDAYGLSLVSVQAWGVIWGVLSTAFIIGGIVIAKWGLGKNPLRSLFLANITIWAISSVFTIHPSIYPLMIGMFIYLVVMPFIEASEQTIFQKVVPQERLGRVTGFAQSVEQIASPVTAFVIGPITQFIVIPFMTTGSGVDLIGGWFGTGPARAIALVFTITGVIGLGMTLFSMSSKYYKQLSHYYITN